jgi:hypothetical protein
MKTFLKNIEVTDVLQFLGLTKLGAGLFFIYNIGVSMAVIGTILFGIGFFGGAFKKKG